MDEQARLDLVKILINLCDAFKETIDKVCEYYG